MESPVLVVDDVEAAQDELVARGVEVSEVFHDAGGVFHRIGGKDRLPGPDPGPAPEALPGLVQPSRRQRLDPSGGARSLNSRGDGITDRGSPPG